MEKKQKKTQEEIFRERAPHYLVCHIERCPLRDHCLRWLVGRYADSRPLAVNSVNPLHPQVATQECPLYRENRIEVHAKGMVHFYDDMPKRKEANIRDRLIGMYNRRKYYEYRNGVRLITPEMQQDILRVCQESGWTAPPRYDGSEEDYVW